MNDFLMFFDTYDGVLKDIALLVIETMDENSKTIVKITPDFIDVADGYRVRLKPRCNVSFCPQTSKSVI